MPKKSLGKKLEVAGKKAITQLQHRAEEGAKALHQAAVDLNNAQVNISLHSDRHTSQDIIQSMSKQQDSIFSMFKESQEAVDSLQAQYDELVKKSQDIKNNREVVEQLQKAHAELTLARGAYVVLTNLVINVTQQDLIQKASAASNDISNAPKESAAKEAAGAGKPVAYSKELAQKIADEALAKMKTLQGVLTTAVNEATQHYDYIKQSCSLVAKALKEIKDKIFILSTYEAAAIRVEPAAAPAAAAPSNSAQERSGFDAMQRQLLEAQAEIERLRASVGLGNPAAAAQPAAAFTPQASAQASAAGAGLGAAAAPMNASAAPATDADKDKAPSMGHFGS